MSKLMRGVRWVQSGQGEARVENLSFFFLQEKTSFKYKLGGRIYFMLLCEETYS